jgi:outer membrane protein OmpA-like peptidoglycan-associated protein
MMHLKTIPARLGVALIAAALGGCSINPETGKREYDHKVVGATVGGVAGGIIGAVVAGKRGALIGVAAGAAAGGGTGYWMEQRAEALKAELQESGMEVITQADPVTGQPMMVIQAPADVAFAVGSADLRSTAFNGLFKIAESVKTQPGLKIGVVGHTDSTGSQQLNAALSRARARSVAEYLYSAGVPIESVTVSGLGPAAPIASNATAEGRAKNRRVEIQISNPAI